MRKQITILLLALLLGFFVLPAQAQVNDTIVVTAASGPDGLAQAVAQASDGGTIEIHGGHYNGPIAIDKPLTLVGEDWPVVDGRGKGSVLHITGPGTTVTGVVVRNSGDSLDQENSGIVVEAGNVTIANNRLEETLFGIYLRHADGSTIHDNEIASKNLDVPRRGDAIRVWYSNDAGASLINLVLLIVPLMGLRLGALSLAQERCQRHADTGDKLCCDWRLPIGAARNGCKWTGRVCSTTTPANLPFPVSVNPNVVSQPARRSSNRSILSSLSPVFYSPMVRRARVR